MRTMEIKAANGSVTLSKLALGSTYYGGSLSREESFAQLDLYYKLGGRTLDTARCYSQTGPGGMEGAERVIGAWLRERGVRGEMTLVTKGAFYPGQPVRVTPEAIREDFADSQRCLGFDKVDVYFLHRDNPDVPVGPLMEALHRLVEAGHIRALGASNWRVERIIQANEYAAKHALTPFTVSQIQWSLAAAGKDGYEDRSAQPVVCMDGDAYEQYLALGMPVMAFAAQAKGLYSKYLAGGIGALSEKSRRFFSEENIAKAAVIQEIAARRGVSPTAVVLGYITCNRLLACALIGSSRPEQLADSMSARDLLLDADEIARLEQGA